MQLHRGDLAAQYFAEADQLASQQKLVGLKREAEFFQAFALLDQGLDQTSIGGHPQAPEKLRQAIAALKAVINSNAQGVAQVSSLVFMGWAHADLNEYEQSRRYLNQAKQLSQDYRMPATYGYASYSLMKTYLDERNYASVIQLKDDPLTTRLQAIYLARAYYETGQARQAIATLNRLKNNLPELWQTQDSQRLRQYQQAASKAEQALSIEQQQVRPNLSNNTPTPPNLPAFAQLQPEPDAHLVYCESDWAH